MANEISGRGIKYKYLTTWASPDGMSRRKIDYVAANAKYRSTSRTEQSDENWRAGVNRNRKRQVQTMQIYYNAAQKYKGTIPDETGAKLKYDIREIRIGPGRLTK